MSFVGPVCVLNTSRQPNYGRSLETAICSYKAGKGEDGLYLRNRSYGKRYIYIFFKKGINSSLPATVCKKGWAEECSILQFEFWCTGRRRGERGDLRRLTAYALVEALLRQGETKSGSRLPPLQALKCSRTGSGCDLTIPLYFTPSQHEPMTEQVGGELLHFSGSKYSVHHDALTIPAAT